MSTFRFSHAGTLIFPVGTAPPSILSVEFTWDESRLWLPGWALIGLSWLSRPRVLRSYWFRLGHVTRFWPMADNDSEDWWGTREETVFLQLEVRLPLSKPSCDAGGFLELLAATK